MDSDVKTYLPRVRLFVSAGVFYLALAAGIFAWALADGWGAGSFGMLTAACIGFYACCAIFCATSVVMHRPRLLVSAQEIRLCRVFRTETVDRSDLGLFELVPAGMIYLRRPPLAARARVRAGGSDGSSSRRTEFVLSDVFDAPIWSIQQALNRSHPDPNLRRTFSPAFDNMAITPWASLGLTGFILFVFAVQTILLSRLPGEYQGPSGWALWALGGLHFRSVYQDGEWYRVLVGPLLHGNLRHVVLNSLGLLLAGSILERIIGHARLLAVFFVGLAASAQFSLWFDTPVTVSVGCSGGIMTLFAVILAGSFRMRSGPARHSLRRLSFLVLVLSLMPLEYIGPGARMDIAAHLGGALTGLVLSPLLFRQFSAPGNRPHRMGIVKLVVLIGIVATETSLSLAAVNYPRHLALIENVMPQDQVPRADNDWPLLGPVLVGRFPGDPRSHFAYAQTLTRSGRFAPAEQELRTARQLIPATEILIGPGFDRSIAFSLAFVLARQGKKDAAIEEARPLCAAAAQGGLDPRSAQFLKTQRLCN